MFIFPQSVLMHLNSPYILIFCQLPGCFTCPLITQLQQHLYTPGCSQPVFGYYTLILFSWPSVFEKLMQSIHLTTSTIAPQTPTPCLYSSSTYTLIPMLTSVMSIFKNRKTNQHSQYLTCSCGFKCCNNYQCVFFVTPIVTNLVRLVLLL